MSSKAKVVTTVLVVAGALSAFDASSASATWLVNGTPLTGSAAVSTQALVDENYTFLVPGFDLVAVCSGHFLDSTNPQIFGSDKVFASALTFLGCSVVTPTKCELEGQPASISTTAILALAAKGTGEAAKVTFTPETKTTFTNIEFKSNNECAFKGLEPITGAFVEGAPTGQLSLLAQAITGLGSTEGNNSLQIGGQKAFIDGGRELLTLASDSKWSFD
jgi:hypothetical protein